MKEYKVQALEKGKWIVARIPFCGVCKTMYSISEANDFIVRCKEEWEKAVRENKDNYSFVPTDYRIVSREVTEWKPE